jgi:hypothetical protein
VSEKTLAVATRRTKKPKPQQKRQQSLRDNLSDESSIEGEKVAAKGRRHGVNSRSAKAKTAKSSRLKRTAKSTPRNGSATDTTSNLDYEGPPRKPLNVPGGWPKGWTEQSYIRMSGATKGDSDSYWFTPENQIRIRSIKNVKLFLQCLDRCKGDEQAAYKMLPTK